MQIEHHLHGDYSRHVSLFNKLFGRLRMLSPCIFFHAFLFGFFWVALSDSAGF